MNKQIIYGLHAVESAIKNNRDTVIDVYCQKTRHDARLQSLMDLAKQSGIPCHFSEAEQLNLLSSNAAHQGVVANIKETVAYTENDLFKLIQKLDTPAFILILDGVQDPHNLGAILRTADAAGVHAVIAPKDNSVGITPVVRKVASGAAETVPFVQVTNLARTIQELQKNGIWVYGLDERGEISIFEAELKGPVAIVMGAEGSGLRRLTKKHCDHLMSIPMKGTVDSLNVSVATGVVLYECLRQKNAP